MNNTHKWSWCTPLGTSILKVVVPVPWVLHQLWANKVPTHQRILRTLCAGFRYRYPAPPPLITIIGTICNIWRTVSNCFSIIFQALLCHLLPLRWGAFIIATLVVIRLTYFALRRVRVRRSQLLLRRLGRLPVDCSSEDADSESD